jgi:hypothetical protein
MKDLLDSRVYKIRRGTWENPNQIKTFFTQRSFSFPTQRGEVRAQSVEQTQEPYPSKATQTMTRLLGTLVLIAATFGVISSSANLDDNDNGGRFATSQVLHRWLEMGDFELFNDAIQDLKLVVPDPAPIVQQILFQLDINLTNVYCVDISIGDMTGDYTLTSDHELLYMLSIDPYSMTCYTDYTYSYGGFLSSSGTANMAMTAGNGVNLTLSLQSPSTFDRAPPNATALTSCVPRVDIGSVQFTGAIESIIASLFQDVVTNAVEGQVATGTLVDSYRVFYIVSILLPLSGSLHSNSLTSFAQLYATVSGTCSICSII